MAKTLKKNKPVVAKNNRPFTSPIASAIVSVIAILWTIPTFGLVVTSFRDKEAILSSGWWASFTNPSFTLANFREVLFTGGGSLGAEGMIPFAVNSLAITIPAVVRSWRGIWEAIHRCTLWISAHNLKGGECRTVVEDPLCGPASSNVRTESCQCSGIAVDINNR